jgi:hypothetical protein
MTDQDKEALNKMAQDMLDWKFHHPMNSKEAALVLHDVSALLVKISNHIKKKIEDYESTQPENDNTVD